MRITAIRVGKLISGPGFANTRVELEAAVDSADDEETTVEMLSAACDRHLARLRGVEAAPRVVADIEELERQRAKLRDEVQELHAIVSRHEKLARLAQALNLEGGGDLLDQIIPF